MGTADGSTELVAETVHGRVVFVDAGIDLVLMRASDGRVLVVGPDVLALPMDSVRLGMYLQCVVTMSRPTRVMSARADNAPNVSHIIRALPEPQSDVDTGPVLSAGARPGDVVVPPLPKDESS